MLYVTDTYIRKYIPGWISRSRLTLKLPLCLLVNIKGSTSHILCTIASILPRQSPSC